MNVFTVSDKLILGRQTESGITTIQFPIKKWIETYGSGGTFHLWNRRSQDADMYPVTISSDTEYVYWTPTYTDLAYNGRGEAVLDYTFGTLGQAGYRKACSETFETEVKRVPSSTNTTPAAYEAWVTQVESFADRAEAAAEEAESAVEEKFGDMTATATTLTAGSSATATYNSTTNVMSFGIPRGSQGEPGQNGEDGEDGEDGFSPTLSVSDITGGHRITITDADGTRTVDVMDGAKGDPGDPGTTVFDELTSRPKYNGSAMTSNTNIPEVKTSAWDGAVTALNGHTVGKNVPSDAVFTDTIYDDTALSGRVTAAENDIDTLEGTVANHSTEIANLTSDKENTSNKVTSISSASTDTQYPSAKCVYDLEKVEVIYEASLVNCTGYCRLYLTKNFIFVGLDITATTYSNYWRNVATYSIPPSSLKELPGFPLVSMNGKVGTFQLFDNDGVLTARVFFEEVNIGDVIRGNCMLVRDNW